MNMLGAAMDTFRIAQKNKMWEKDKNLPASMQFAHLDEMYETMNSEDFSEGKLGRWLGWMQACVVAAGCATLEEMKELNKRWV